MNDLSVEIKPGGDRASARDSCSRVGVFAVQHHQDYVFVVHFLIGIVSSRVGMAQYQMLVMVHVTELVVIQLSLLPKKH